LEVSEDGLEGFGLVLGLSYLFLQVLVLLFHFIIHFVQLVELLAAVVLLADLLDGHVVVVLLPPLLLLGLRLLIHVEQVLQFLLCCFFLLMDLRLELELCTFNQSLILALGQLQIIMREPVDEADDTFQRGHVVFVLAGEPVLVAEVLHELNVGVQILQDLLLLDLKERIDAAGEEHVGAVGLPVEAGFLQHY